MTLLSAQSEETAGNHERLLHIVRRSGGGRHGGRARLLPTWRVPVQLHCRLAASAAWPRESGVGDVRPPLWPVETAVLQAVLLCPHRGTRWRREDGECSRCLCFLPLMNSDVLGKGEGSVHEAKGARGQSDPAHSGTQQHAPRCAMRANVVAVGVYDHAEAVLTFWDLGGKVAATGEPRPDPS